MIFDQEYFDFGRLDALSYKNTVIHRLDPRTKVTAVFAFIITVISFPKHEISGLLPFFVLPVLLFSLGDIPVWLVVKKVLCMSPFAVLIGIFNPILDHHVMASVFGFPVTGGILSFLSILLRFFLTLSSALLLIATTSFPGICHALGKLGMPKLFIAQLLFLYRYIFVLMEEALRMVNARDLRCFGSSGRGIKVFSGLIATLFIRTVERSERIYQSMLARGFTGTMQYARHYRFRAADGVFLLMTAILLYVLRCCDVVETIGKQAVNIF